MVVSGIVALSPLVMLLFCGLIAVVDLGVFFVALRVFAREEILVRWK